METKEITIYDIAKALQISPSTVSRGLNDHATIRKNTKMRIMEVAQTMDISVIPLPVVLELQEQIPLALLFHG